MSIKTKAEELVQEIKKSGLDEKIETVSDVTGEFVVIVARRRDFGRFMLKEAHFHSLLGPTTSVCSKCGKPI